MVVPAITQTILAGLIQNHVAYFKSVYTTWKQVLAAPEQIQEVGRQAEAFCVCVEALLRQVNAEGSIITTNASEEAGTIEQFLQGSAANLRVLMDMAMRYSIELPDGGRTWADTFTNTFNSFAWTQQRGKVDDLIRTIRQDIEIVTSITVAMQAKSTTQLRSALSEVAKDTAYICEGVDDIRRGMSLIHELLSRVLDGRQDALENIFPPAIPRSHDSSEIADLDLPPPYTAEPEPSVDAITSHRSHGLEIGNPQCLPIRSKKECITIKALNVEGLEKGNSQCGEIVQKVELNEIRVTTAEFLWCMAKVAAEVHPWDNKIRSTNRFSDGSSDKALYGVISHLMAITEPTETRMRWSSVSIASWLTAAAWYLSMARYKLACRSDSHQVVKPMEIYASFVKVHWIVLTIDHHPQKPLHEDAGQTSREREQYENLVAALHNEVANAGQLLGRQGLQSIVATLRQNLGRIWEREIDQEAIPSDHIIAAYASRILESAPASQSYSRPSSEEELGQWTPLCPRTCITLPRPHEHLPPKPTLFACMCDNSLHLDALKNYYITKDSYSDVMNDTTVEVYNLGVQGSQGVLSALAVECPSQETRDNLFKQLDDAVERLALLQYPGPCWITSNFTSKKDMRVVRSPFDSGKPGSSLTQIQPAPIPETLQAAASPKESNIEVATPIKLNSIWSGFWSMFGLEIQTEKRIRKARRKEMKMKMKMKEISEDQLKIAAPKPKPPDNTQALAISPLTIQFYSRCVGGSLHSTLHIVSPTSCFEIWFDIESLFNVHRPSQSPKTIAMSLPSEVTPSALENSRQMDLLLEFENCQEVERFQRSLLIARNHSILNVIELSARSSRNSTLETYSGWKIPWESQIQSCTDNLVRLSHTSFSTSKRLLLAKRLDSSRAKIGMLWDTSNMEHCFLFKIDFHSNIYCTVPSVSSHRKLRIRVKCENPSDGDCSVIEELNSTYEEPSASRLSLTTGSTETKSMETSSRGTQSTESRSTETGSTATRLTETESVGARNISSLDIEFNSSEDTRIVRELCEGGKLGSQFTIKELVFEPARKFKIHTSSRLHSARAWTPVIVEVWFWSSALKPTLQIWLPAALDSNWDTGRSHVMTFSQSKETRCIISSNNIFFEHTEMVPLFEKQSSSQDRSHLRWKGNFELYFKRKREAQQMYKALIEGKAEPDDDEGDERPKARRRGSKASRRSTGSSVSSP